MRVSDLISLAKDCLLAAVIFVIIFSLIFFIGYRLIYKKLMKGSKKLSASRFLLYAMLACYILVVFGATLLRRGYAITGIRLMPFYSYLEAWYQFKDSDWRNLILNIFMLVPFGLLLPYAANIFRKFLPTALAGIGFTLVIELTQLILKRGIFEVDDLINNTLGTIIGYGFFLLADYLSARLKKEKKAFVPMLVAQIPLVITCLSFITIFTVHECNELGNLQCHHITSAKLTSVTCNADFDATPEQAYVYIVPIANVEETANYARDFFAKQGYSLDESRTDIYDESAVYYCDNNGENSMSLWFDYEGNKIEYTHFGATFSEGGVTAMKDDASEQELRNAIETLGFFLPAEAQFENMGDGNYRFICECLEDGDYIYDGITTCRYNIYDVIAQLDCNTVRCTPYKEFPIITEEEAYQEIKEGRFRFEPSYAPENILVNDIFLSYEIDSKGFYQPIYIFECTVDGLDTRLYTPAIR